MATGRLGIIADVQYADCDDGRSFHGTTRYYRDGLVKLKAALAAFAEQGVDAVIHAGDLIDGKAKERAEETLRRCASEFATLPPAVRRSFAIGNHELYHLDRSIVYHALGMDGGPAFHAFDLGGVADDGRPPPVRVVVLDSFEIGVYGRPRDDERCVRARELLAARNSNASLNDSTGLTGVDKRWVQYNGGLGEEQIAWLDGQCAAAGRAGQVVVVVAHVPLNPRATHLDGLTWDYEEALEVIARHACVVMTVCGHDHDGGYACDAGGVHHVVMPGVVEVEVGASATLVVQAGRSGATGRPTVSLEPGGVTRSRVRLEPGRLCTALADLTAAVVAAGGSGDDDDAAAAAPAAPAGGSSSGTVDWSDSRLCCHDLDHFVRVGPGGSLEVVSPRLGAVDLLRPAFVGGRWAGPPLLIDESGDKPRPATAALARALTSDGATPAADIPEGSVHLHATIPAGAVKSLRLASNPLGDLPRGHALWGAVAATLKWLDVSRCGLTAVPEAVRGMVALRRISLQGNAIGSLPPWLAALPIETVELDASAAAGEASLATLRRCASLTAAVIHGDPDRARNVADAVQRACRVKVTVVHEGGEGADVASRPGDSARATP